MPRWVQFVSSDPGRSYPIHTVPFCGMSGKKVPDWGTRRLVLAVSIVDQQTTIHANSGSSVREAPSDVGNARNNTGMEAVCAESLSSDFKSAERYAMVRVTCILNLELRAI